MKFVCVLSVGGSLASYSVSGAPEEGFMALLKGIGEGRQDIPGSFTIEKMDGHWQVKPEHEEIVPALIHCLEGGR